MQIEVRYNRFGSMERLSFYGLRLWGYCETMQQALDTIEYHQDRGRYAAMQKLEE
jgi:hypothetical protein